MLVFSGKNFARLPVCSSTSAVTYCSRTRANGSQRLLPGIQPLHRKAAHSLSHSLRSKQFKQIKHICKPALSDLSVMPASNLYAHSPNFSYTMHSVAHFCSLVRIQSADLRTVCTRTDHRKQSKTLQLGRTFWSPSIASIKFLCSLTSFLLHCTKCTTPLQLCTYTDTLPARYYYAN